MILPPTKNTTRGHALDPERVGELRVLIDVDLGEDGASASSFVIASSVVERGLTRPTPSGPEVEQDRRLDRALDDLFLEGRGRDVEDQGAVWGLLFKVSVCMRPS